MEILKYLNNRFKKDVIVNKIFASTFDYNMSRQMYPIRSWWDSPDNPSAMMPGPSTINIEIKSSDIRVNQLVNGQDLIVETYFTQDFTNESKVNFREIMLTDVCILESFTTYNASLENYECTIKLVASTLKINDLNRRVV